ncbi:MAG: hypothetical protein B6245_01840 [Desulfobacteraceae bacterium 4572_88]|nr:MAG: hypothetical protein B6245_01840 [Desulfobacteraceae bacterium 4572_88]RLC07582.1 MAG: hypothetical protein DRI57_25700 [Deltaproteobacteria bacterium]
MMALNPLKLFRKIFKGRQDILARRWTSPKTGRSGYSPLCKNEWKRPECRKGQIPNACVLCEHTDYASLSSALLQGHLTGKHMLGIYPLLTDHTCHFIAADFDNHGGNQSPLTDVTAFYEICQVQEIPCYVFRSRSGRGYHVFIFFQSPVPAWKARTVAFALLREADVIACDTEISSFDRLFPNQDRLSGKGFGNLIALPFQGKAMAKGHTLLLDPDSDFRNPYPFQWHMLAGVRKTSESDLDNLIAAWDLVRTSADTLPEKIKWHNISGNAHENPGYLPPAYLPADFNRISDKCRFIAHCRDDAETLSEPDWYILLTIAARCENGKQISHRLSNRYPGYTPEETEAKIHQALSKTGPYCCQTIRKINGNYCRICPHYGQIRSPIVLGNFWHRYLQA